MKKTRLIFNSDFLTIIFVVFSIFSWGQTTVIYNYTGNSQSFTVPVGVTSIAVKIWGAGGGGSDGSGGSGAFLKGTLAVTPGESYVIIVGGGGTYSTTVHNGGFGGGGNAGAYGGSGGGYSGIFLNSVSQANAKAIAGGGGGGGYFGDTTYGGAGGATTGSNANNQSNNWTGGLGGSITSGGQGGLVGNANGTVGNAGGSLSGGVGGNNTYCGGGGGGGYYGGGGGYGSNTTNRYSSGGGGGSSYVSTSLSNVTNNSGTTNNSGVITQAPGNTETEYITGIGNGGDGSFSVSAGGNGLIVITYITTTSTISPSGASSCNQDYVRIDAPINYGYFENFSSNSGWAFGGSNNRIKGFYFNSANAGGTANEAGLGYDTGANFNGTWYFFPYGVTVSDYKPIDITSFSTLNLTFKHMFDADIVNYTGSNRNISVEISTNGTTWNTLWSISSITADIAANTISPINLNSYISNSTIYIRFVYSGASWGLNAWYVDDIGLTGQTKVTWLPITELYTDSSLSTAYVAGASASSVYATPNGSQMYTASFPVGASTVTATTTVIHNKKIFTGATDNNWSVANNWKPSGVPDIDKCVNVPTTKNLIVDVNNAMSNKVTVDSGASLNITTNNTLTIQNELVNNNPSATPNVTVQNDANLIQINNTAINTGNITVNRSTNANLKRLDYVYWSSPVTGQGLQSFSPGTLASRFYTYNEATDLFVSVPSISTATFNSGVGYAIRVPNSYPSTTPGTQQFNGVFKGVPNNGTTITYPATKIKSGYNLIGNPYPSNLELDGPNGFYKINENFINNKFYFWTNYAPNPTSTIGYSGPNYAIWNASGTVFPGNPNAPSTIIPTSSVKIGQSFIVQAHTSGTLVFNNAMRTSATSTFVSKNTTPKDRYLLSMITPANNYSNQLIAYVEGATNDLDANFDAEKIETPSDDFYSIVAGKKLTIQGRQYPLLISDIVPVGNKYAETGTYKITLSKKEGIFEQGQSIYLHDKDSGTYTDLQLGDYTFTANQGEQNDRFEITYKPSGTLNTDTNDLYGVRVYLSGNNYVIESDKEFQYLKILDVSGKQLFTINSGKKKIIIEKSKLNEGVNVFSIIFADRIINKKVLSK